MKKEERVYKPFSIMSFVFLSVLILYLGIRIGDTIYLMTGLDSLFSRYLPMAFYASIGTFFVARSLVKKEYKSEEENVKDKLVIAPVIVAVVLLLYGLYSVHENMKYIRNEVEKEYKYSSVYSPSVIYQLEKEIEPIMEKAKSDAIMNWMTTTIIYIVVAELTIVALRTKVDTWLLEGSPETVQYDKPIKDAFFEGTMSKEKELNEKTKDNVNEESNEEKKPKRRYTDEYSVDNSENNIKDTMQGIKWNL